MTWHLHPLLLLPVFFALLTASLAWFGWSKRPARDAASFAVVMVAAAIWAGGNVLELGAADLPTKVFFLKFEYIGIVLLPTAWLIFALEYSGYDRRLNRRTLAILAIEPLVILLLLWTNETHGLFTRHFEVRQAGMLLEWNNVAGPAYWANIVYSYALIAVGNFLLLYHFSRLPAPHSRRELVILLGALLPWFANMAYTLYDFPVPGLDPTPFMLALTGLAFAWGLFSLRFLDLHPAQTTSPQELQAWRLRVLDGILRGILIIWLFALASGINNVIEAYQQERDAVRDPLATAPWVIAFYISVTILFVTITFLRHLPYSLRAGIFLAILYLLGAVGLALASLSGDGRVFLFSFTILSAILFGLRFGLFSVVLSLLTMIVMGWLQVNGVLVVPAERQINSTDVGAWVSGTLVFLILSTAALISTTYLLQMLENTIVHLRKTLNHEQRLTNMLRTIGYVNQLIVRERHHICLLEQVCEHLVAERGYTSAWVGLVEADGVTLKPVASADKKVDWEKLVLRLDGTTSGPTCVASALQGRRIIRIPEDDPCEACPLLSTYPQRSSLVLPIVSEERTFGVLAVDHAAPSFFDDDETTLLKELADDLAHALTALRAEEQQRALAELSSGLLFARNEDTLWTEVIAAAQKVLQADRVAIYGYDRENDALSCLRSYGLSPEYVDEINCHFHEVPGSALLRDPQPVVIQDIESDDAVGPLREWMRREGFRSYAVFPVYTSQGLSGAFVAYRNMPTVFTSSDLAAGQTLVRIIGLALENLAINAETKRKASELGTLYAAAQEMAFSMLDSASLLQVLARHVTEALQATSAYIVSVDLENQTLRVVSEYWSAHALPSERKSDLDRLYLLKDYPAFWRILKTGKAGIIHEDDPQASEIERQQFIEYGVRSILFVPVMVRGKTLGGLEVWESRRRREFTLSEIFLVQAMAGHAAAILESLQLFEQLREAYDKTLEGWARALELRDELTEGHTRRVTELTVRLARAMGLSEEHVEHIRRGAILHDIGKMAIPDAILHKKGPLTPAEERLVRLHPQFAYEMLYPIEFLRPALDIPYCHHERWDGSGYPQGLKGEQIPLAARIFAVIDVWDAITSDRPYRPAWSREEALRYMGSQAGKQFDPRVLEVFLSLIVG